MPKWGKWLSLIATGFLTGFGSAQVDGSAASTKVAVIRGGIGAALTALGGWTDTTRAGSSGGKK